MCPQKIREHFFKTTSHLSFHKDETFISNRVSTQGKNMIKVVFLILLSLSTIQIYASEHIGPYDENLISSFTQLNWDGPEVKITNGLLNVAGKELTPLYLSVNPQAVGRFPGKEEEAWQRIFNQVDLALQNGVDDYSYCFLESGEHMRRCGYPQNDYDRNLQVALNTDHRSRGLCVCGPKSLFKWEWSPGQYGAAISKDGESFCSIGGIDHLNQCGYQASQYGPAPIFDVHKSKMEFKNSCNCP